MKFLQLTAFSLCILFSGLTVHVHAQNFDSIPIEEPQMEVATSSASAAPKSSVCGDDERLMDIVTYMETTEPVKPLLTMSAETYLLLDQEVRQALAGKMLICPDNIVLKNGKPMKKIVVNFDTVFEQIMQAVTAENFEEITRLATAFTLAPSEPKDIVSYFTPIKIDADKTKQLANALGLVAPKSKDDFLYIVDIFNGLNGKATKSESVYWISGRSNHSLDSDIANLPKNSLYIVGVEELKIISQQVTKTGLKLIVPKD